MATKSSANRQATRAGSIQRGKIRKNANREANEARHHKNLQSDSPTPWELAKAARAKARASKRETWLKRQIAS